MVHGEKGEMHKKDTREDKEDCGIDEESLVGHFDSPTPRNPEWLTGEPKQDPVADNDDKTTYLIITAEVIGQLNILSLQLARARWGWVRYMEVHP